MLKKITLILLIILPVSLVFPLTFSDPTYAAPTPKDQLKKCDNANNPAKCKRQLKVCSQLNGVGRAQKCRESVLDNNQVTTNIKECNRSSDINKCKKEYRNCNQKNTKDKKNECKVDTLGKFEPREPPKIDSCEKTQDSKRCKQEYRKCNKITGKIREQRVAECQIKAVKDQKKRDTEQYQGSYLCGNIRDDNGKLTDDNYKTKFDFGCLGAKGPEGLNPINDLLYAFLRFISAGVGIAVVIALIGSGIQYTASEGNAEATAKAKNRIRSVIIGLFVYIFAFSLFQFLVPGGLFK